MLPSVLVARLQGLFPALVEKVLPMEAPGDSVTKGEAPEEIAATAVLPFVIHPRQTLSYLTVQLGRWKEGKSLHPIWWEVYNWYVCGGAKEKAARRLLGGLFYRNTETSLKVQTSHALYGSRLQASASRLERFRFCPFAHFAAYGLRLQQRAQYGLEASDTGRFFHAALRNVASVLQGEQRCWSDCRRDELLQLVSKEVAKLLPHVQREILLSSHRYNYLAKKMEEAVGRAVLCLAEHDRRSAFKPLALEIGFGRDGELPPLRPVLPVGSPVEVVGRIDRVDGARSATGNTYLRVIDYKSGATDLNLTEVLHGLSLQLLLYLDAALSNAALLYQSQLSPDAAVMPAGIFYFRVFNPLVRSNGPRTPDIIEDELLKLFKLKGKILAEPAVVQLMDNELQSGYSKIIPAGLNKQGELYRVKSLLTAASFEQLRQHIRSLVAETATQILQGNLKISPFKLGHKKACTYCLYKSVCQFDLLLEENCFRLLGSNPEFVS